MSPAPICLMIIGLVILYFYPINEKRRQENHILLMGLRWGWELIRLSVASVSERKLQLKPLCSFAGILRIQRQILQNSPTWSSVFDTPTHQWRWLKSILHRAGPVNQGLFGQAGTVLSNQLLLLFHVKKLNNSKAFSHYAIHSFFQSDLHGLTSCITSNVWVLCTNVFLFKD